MIDLNWLLLLLFICLPAFIVGVVFGGSLATRDFYTKVHWATYALKRAEAYEAYKKAISND